MIVRVQEEIGAGFFDELVGVFPRSVGIFQMGTLRGGMSGSRSGWVGMLLLARPTQVKTAKPDQPEQACCDEDEAEVCF